MADGGGDVAHPGIRELLFADLPPLTAIETFAAALDRRDLAQAAAREDEPAAREFPEITLTTFRAVRWNMPFYARMGFEPVPEREQRAALREVVDDETARGLDQAARCVMRYRAGKPRGRRA